MTAHKKSLIIFIIKLFRAPSRDQTSDLLITSQLLYQLSYGGVPYFRGAKVRVLTIPRNFSSKKTTKLHAQFLVDALNQQVAFVPLQSFSQTQPVLFHRF